jgi:hypothetical protein
VPARTAIVVQAVRNLTDRRVISWSIMGLDFSTALVATVGVLR